MQKIGRLAGQSVACLLRIRAPSFTWERPETVSVCLPSTGHSSLILSAGKDTTGRTDPVVHCWCALLASELSFQRVCLKTLVSELREEVSSYPNV